MNEYRPMAPSSGSTRKLLGEETKVPRRLILLLNFNSKHFSLELRYCVCKWIQHDPVRTAKETVNTI